MLTRSLVIAILLLGAVACGSDFPTQPTPARPVSQAPPVSADLGDYQLTLTASPSCSLPTQLMKRIYKAHIRAWAGFPEVAVDVTGAAFFEDWAVGFGGTRDGDTLRFKIVGMGDGSFDDLFNAHFAEQIDATKWLAYDGTAVATIGGNKSITGAFDGQIALRDASRAVLAECRATDHKIEFAP